MNNIQNGSEALDLVEAEEDVRALEQHVADQQIRIKHLQVAGRNDDEMKAREGLFLLADALEIAGIVYWLNGRPAAFGKLLQRAIIQSWPMPRLSISPMAAVICCFTWVPAIYAGQGEPSAPGRLVPGGWLQPATPRQPPPVAEAAPSRQPSAPEPVLARGLPKPAPGDNLIPIRPAKARSTVRQPIVIHRAQPPVPARTGPRLDGKVEF